MDGNRFDQFARALAIGASRRKILRGVAGAAALAAANGRSALAAPNPCAVACAGLPGPQKAACKQACRECGGDINQVCIGFGPVGPSSFVCCPEGTTCDQFTGECVEVTICPETGEPAENCALGISTNCPENEACAFVDDVDNGCFCMERTCGTPCISSADCDGVPCVEVPGCCEDLRFCATPCGRGGTGITTAGWR